MDQRHPSFFVCDQPVFRRHAVGKVGGDKCENITFRLDKRKKNLIVQSGKTDKFPELMGLIGYLPVQLKKSRYIGIANHAGNLGAQGKAQDKKTVNNIQFFRIPVHSRPVNILISIL